MYLNLFLIQTLYKSFLEEVWRRIGKSDEAGTSISFRVVANGYCYFIKIATENVQTIEYLTQ